MYARIFCWFTVFKSTCKNITGALILYIQKLYVAGNDMRCNKSYRQRSFSKNVTSNHLIQFRSTTRFYLVHIIFIAQFLDYLKSKRRKNTMTNVIPMICKIMTAPKASLRITVMKGYFFGPQLTKCISGSEPEHH